MNIRQALSKYRPRKVDRGKVVLVDKAGKVIESGVGAVVYVPPTGKPQLMSEHYMRKGSQERLDQYRENIRRGKELRKLEGVKAKFRPRKGDKESFVFVGLDGKRLPEDSKRKGYLFYVNQVGDVEVLQNPRDKGKVPVPRRQSNFNLTDMGKKRALKKALTGKRMTVETGDIKGQSIPLERLGKVLGGELQRASARFKSQRNFTLDLLVVVELPNGSRQTLVIDPVGFKQADLQVIATPFYQEFVMTKVYAFIASALSLHQFVTSQSARYIQKLSQNKGKARKNWTKKGGAFKWEKSGFKDVKVKQVQWQLSRVRIESKGRKKKGKK